MAQLPLKLPTEFHHISLHANSTINNNKNNIISRCNSLVLPTSPAAADHAADVAADAAAADNNGKNKTTRFGSHWLPLCGVGVGVGVGVPNPCRRRRSLSSSVTSKHRSIRECFCTRGSVTPPRASTDHLAVSNISQIKGEGQSGSGSGSFNTRRRSSSSSSIVNSHEEEEADINAQATMIHSENRNINNDIMKVVQESNLHVLIEVADGDHTDMEKNANRVIRVSNGDEDHTAAEKKSIIRRRRRILRTSTTTTTSVGGGTGGVLSSSNEEEDPSSYNYPRDHVSPKPNSDDVGTISSSSSGGRETSHDQQGGQVLINQGIHLQQLNYIMDIQSSTTTHRERIENAALICCSTSEDPMEESESESRRRATNIGGDPYYMELVDIISKPPCPCVVGSSTTRNNIDNGLEVALLGGTDMEIDEHPALGNKSGSVVVSSNKLEDQFEFGLDFFKPNYGGINAGPENILVNYMTLINNPESNLQDLEEEEEEEEELDHVINISTRGGRAFGLSRLFGAKKLKESAKRGLRVLFNPPYKQIKTKKRKKKKKRTSTMAVDQAGSDKFWSKPILRGNKCRRDQLPTTIEDFPYIYNGAGPGPAEHSSIAERSGAEQA